MQRILVVCGAGASSTFLVHWMRKLAESRGLDYVIDAGSREEIQSRLPGLNAVLVAAHLADSYPALLVEATDAGVPAALLPTVRFDTAGASQALDVLEALLISSNSSGAALGGPDDAGRPRG